MFVALLSLLIFFSRYLRIYLSLNFGLFFGLLILITVLHIVTINRFWFKKWFLLWFYIFLIRSFNINKLPWNYVCYLNAHHCIYCNVFPVNIQNYSKHMCGDTTASLRGDNNWYEVIWNNGFVSVVPSKFSWCKKGHKNSSSKSKVLRQFLRNKIKASSNNARVREEERTNERASKCIWALFSYALIKT